MMRYLLPFYIVYIPSGVFFATLRGMGDSLRPTLITFAGVCALRIAWVALVFPAFPTIRALLFCFPVSWTVTSVAYALYFCCFINRRKKNNISLF
jgi:Na+-driven multidrug efflux pump